MTTLRHLLVKVKTANTDQSMWPSMRLKVSWARDHLAVVSYEVADRLDRKLHDSLVNDVRLAATRPIDRARIELPMQRVVTNAGLTETDANLGSVLGRTDDTSATA